MDLLLLCIDMCRQADISRRYTQGCIKPTIFLEKGFWVVGTRVLLGFSFSRVFDNKNTSFLTYLQMNKGTHSSLMISPWLWIGHTP